MTIFAKHLLSADGWLSDARVTVADGIIVNVAGSADPLPGDIHVDTLLPALANLHSHSFQRAMAGRTEFRNRGQESFWTWRHLMYQFLDHITPQHVAAFAAQTFMEMQLAGYASVGEFHYLHHQSGGGHYDKSAEMSLQILQAATETGIGLTHLPVLYSYAGVDRSALANGQLRFGNTLDDFCRLVSDCQTAIRAMTPDTMVGIAPHSLRAASSDDIATAISRFQDVPVHIHIAEQTREVEEIQATLGARPVAWLLNNFDVDDRWCLIHATHMTAAETKAMAESGAIAGLCPITEANLGDGAFDGPRFLENGGAFGVGSDSNVRISLTEELRTLEYSQRLRDQRRNVLAQEGGHTGTQIYTGAASGGAQAIGRNAGDIATGRWADLIAIDRTDPALFGLPDEQLLDGLIFAANDRVVKDVWSAGRHQVCGGVHVNETAITKRYRQAVSDLLGRVNT